MLDNKLLNPLIEATKYTFKVQAQVDAIAIEAFIKKADFKSDLAAKVELLGPGVVGFVTLAFEKSFYLYILSQIFKKEFTVITEDYMDGAAELLNIITTHARKSFNDLGMPTKASLPIVLFAEKLALVDGFTDTMTIQPFETSQGKFHLQIDIKRQN